MIKKSIIAVIAIIIVLGAAALIFSNHNNSINSLNNFTNDSTNSINQNQQDTSVNSNSTSNNKGTSTSTQNKGTSTSGNSQVKLSAADAKNIAQQAYKGTGDTVGTPKLIKQSGKYVYNVLIFKNGKQIGYMDIDAQTGKIVEGAGEP